MGSLCGDNTTTSVQSLPDWITGPAKSTIEQSQAAQTAATAQGYQPLQYTGLNDTQTGAIDKTKIDIGGWTPEFADAQGRVAYAETQPSALAAGSDFINAAGKQNSLSTATPWLSAAGATAQNTLGSVQPYLSSASQTAPGAIRSYMSPYTSSVVDEIGRLGSRNLTENILPNINDTFIGSGQFGSDRNAMTIGRAIRDTGADIAGKQASALEQGYGTAGSLFESDAARQGGLAATVGGLNLGTSGQLAQIGSTAGALTNADAARQLQAGTALGSLAATSSQQYLDQARAAAALSAQQQGQNQSDTAALFRAGSVQQNDANTANQVAQANAQGTQQFPEQQLSWLNSIIRGTQSPVTTATTGPNSTAKDAGSLALLAAGMGSKYGWFGMKGGGRVRPIPGDDFSPLSAYGRKRLAEGGYLDDEDEDYYPDAGGPPDAESGSDSQYIRGGDGGGTGALSILRPSGGDIPMPGALSSASPLRERLGSSLDNSDIKAAQDDVASLQKEALRSRTREKGWGDDPLILTALGALASPSAKPFQAFGQGALSAIDIGLKERREDFKSDREGRLAALKAAQQRLSDLVSLRRTDQLDRTVLGRLEAGDARNATQVTTAGIRANAPTTMEKEMKALGFDPADTDDQAAYADFKDAQKGGQFNRDLKLNIANMNDATRRYGIETASGDRAMSDSTRQLAIRARSGDNEAALELKRQGLDVKQVLASYDRANKLEIANVRSQPKMVNEMAAMELDPTSPQDRDTYAKFILATKPGANGKYAPDRIQKLADIMNDPKAAPAAKEAAERVMGTLGKQPGMSANQFRIMYGQAEQLADRDVQNVLKDFQFPTPDAQTAWREAKRQEHIANLSAGMKPDDIPAAAAPKFAQPKPSGSPEIVTPPTKPAPGPQARSKVDAGEMSKLRGEQSHIDAVLPDLDAVIAALEKESDQSFASKKVGLGAHAQGLYNATIGQVAGNLNKEDTEFWSKMAGLKGRLAPIINDNAGKLKQEYKDLGALLDNSGALTSRDTALSNFREMRSVLAQKRGIAADRLGAGTNTPGTGLPERRGTPKPDGVGEDWSISTYTKDGPNKGKKIWVSPDGKRGIFAE